MTDILLTLSTIITVGAIIPYVSDILKSKTKPNVVSWFTWTLLFVLSSAAAFVAHQYPSAILSGSAALECLIVVILGLWAGEYKYSWFDGICQLGTGIGFGAWLIFNSPLIAILMSIFIDLVGSLPTIRHGWLAPYEETWITFALSGFGALLALAAVRQVSFIAVVMPIWLVLINIILTSTILISRKFQSEPELA